MRIYDTGLNSNFFKMLRSDLREEELLTPDLTARGKEDECAIAFAAANPYAVTIEMVELEDGEFVPGDIVVRI